MIEILQTGQLNSLQDLGRHGLRNIGVSSCGAMDFVALKAGNLLLGNEEGAAALEIQTFPCKILFNDRVIFSITGAVGKITLDGERLSPWCAAIARLEQTLVIEPPLHGSRLYFCVKGGFDVPEILGSRSTSFRGSFGGFEGRQLRSGDRLQIASTQKASFPNKVILAPSPENCLRKLFPPLIDNTLTVRALPASEESLFEVSDISFWEQDWKLTPQSSRTGYRLTGTPLKAKRHMEMHSYGVVAGIVQVPPSGEPIVQMSDANTAGGYPKIAGVVSGDLWRLGQLRPGQKIRFVRCDHAAAARIHKELQEYFTSIKQMHHRLNAQPAGESIHAH